jgi:hypothetical protein
MIEPSRRHGHFDPRFSIRLASATRRLDDLPARLDWAALSGRLFPGRRRHDFEVLKAYEGYKNGSNRSTVEPARNHEAALILVGAS